MFRRAAALLLTLLVLGGCSSQTATPTPTASIAPLATATPAPSPTPVDVGSLFLPQITAMTRGTLELSGALTVGPQSGAVSGTIAFIGSDEDQITTIAIGSTTSKTETIHVAGHGYTKQGDGPWFEDATPPVAGKDLTTVLKGLTTLSDQGTETRHGVLVHRLELPAGTVIDPAAFGLTDPGQKSPTVSVVFFADETGKPISMLVNETWSQVSGTTTIPVTVALEMRFGASTPSIQAPASVWARFSSTRFHYAMAHPADWDVSTADKTVDRFASPGEAFVLIDRIKVPSGSILNDAAKGEIASARRDGFTLVTNQAITLDGQPGRILTFRGKISGSAYVMDVAVTLRAGYGYEFFWFSPKGHEADDLALFRQMLATFAFTK